MLLAPSLLCLGLVDVSLRLAHPADGRAAAALFVEAYWGERHAVAAAAILGDRLKDRVSDTAQLPMRLNGESSAGADSAVGALTALQRELLERHVLEEMEERFFSATDRLPAALLLACDGTSGELVGCAGVEAAVVDRERCLVLRRTRTPLLSELNPDGSLPEVRGPPRERAHVRAWPRHLPAAEPLLPRPQTMEVRATLSCHAVAAATRRQGLGTTLFRRAAELSAAWQSGPLLLMVPDADEEALAFYASLGCTPLFADAGATAMAAELPSPGYTREVLGVHRVPQPMSALEWVPRGDAVAPEAADGEARAERGETGDTPGHASPPDAVASRAAPAAGLSAPCSAYAAPPPSGFAWGGTY